MSNFKYWLPAIVYMALIFWLSSHPAPGPIKAIPIFAHLKIVHIVEYGFLFLLFRWAIIRSTGFDQLEIFSLAFMLTVLFGLTDEFHQIYVAGRTASLVDVIADGVGAILVESAIAFRYNLMRHDNN